MVDLKIFGEDLLTALSTGKLKYIIYDHALYDLDDLQYNEAAKKLWETKSSQFYAWKFYLKPDIKPGSLFRSINGDLWIRLNSYLMCENSSSFDIKKLITRKANYLGKDWYDSSSLHLIRNWDTDWYEFVSFLTEEDWEKDYPTTLKEGLTDEQMFKLLKNPPLNKSEEEILELLNNNEN